MKWLSLFTKPSASLRKRTPEQAWDDAEPSPSEHGFKGSHICKRRSMQERKEQRTSIEQWHEARKTRTSIDICCSGANITTTEKLSVCKAGVTTLINRTYIVIKHLGSGTSGQVKLAFNLRSKKLVAIKAVRKSASYAAAMCGQPGLHCVRSSDGRELMGGQCGLRGSALSRGWRSLTSTALRRSSSATINNHATKWPLTEGVVATPSPPPLSTPGAPLTGAAQSAAQQLSKAEEFVREIAILKRLSHPNVVQLLEVIDDPASDNLLIVMGYVEGNTLQPAMVEPNRWQPVSEEVVWRQARDVLSGLDYLHSHGVVHGDLKPANLIQDSLTGVIKILDFGSAVLHSRQLGEDGLRGAHGPTGCTPAFRSPESLEAGYRPSFELDMWAFGVCLYMWVFGELPYKGSAPFVVYDAIRKQPLHLPTHVRVSTQLSDLITRLLDKNARSRLTARQAMQHSWTSAQGLAPLRPLRRHPLLPPSFSMPQSSMALDASAPQLTLHAQLSEPSQQRTLQQMVAINPSGVAPPGMLRLQPFSLHAASTGNLMSTADSCWTQSSMQPLVPGALMDNSGSSGSLAGASQRLQQQSWANGCAPSAADRLADSWTASVQAAAAPLSMQQEADASTGVLATDAEEDCDQDGRWVLRRSVTDEELEAAISSCINPTGSAAVLMEGIFTEITFPKGHLIIRAGDPLDHIYLIVAGEVEMYHDLAADGPEAQLPNRPLIQGLSEEDPEEHLADPGDFLDIRLPGINESSLERLSTGLFSSASNAERTLTGLRIHNASTTGFSEDGPRSSTTGFSVRSTGTGMLSSQLPGVVVVATKGPGDSLGFAGLAPAAGSVGKQPLWLANVRAKTQLTSFVASIDSLHKLVRMHPQVEPLLRQIAYAQETDMAVAEAMRCLRLHNGAAGRSGSRTPRTGTPRAANASNNTSAEATTSGTPTATATTNSGTSGLADSSGRCKQLDRFDSGNVAMTDSTIETAAGSSVDSAAAADAALRRGQWCS